MRVRDKVGAWGPAARLGGTRPSPDMPTVDLNVLRPKGSPPAWLEVSPSPLGFPAAAEPLRHPAPERWTFPADVWRHLAPGTYHGRVVDASGREPLVFSFTRSCA